MHKVVFNVRMETETVHSASKQQSKRSHSCSHAVFLAREWESGEGRVPLLNFANHEKKKNGIKSTNAMRSMCTRDQENKVGRPKTTPVGNKQTNKQKKT